MENSEKRLTNASNATRLRRALEATRYKRLE
jgi:hypothetical protein